MQPAAATNHYGLGFMESVRTLQFPKFAEGGLIGSFRDVLAVAPPRMAGGGLIASSAAPSSERNIIDLRTDHGTTRDLRASDDTLGQLRKQALVRASVRAGKSQSWDS